MESCARGGLYTTLLEAVSGFVALGITPWQHCTLRSIGLLGALWLAKLKFSVETAGTSSAKACCPVQQKRFFGTRGTKSPWPRYLYNASKPFLRPFGTSTYGKPASKPTLSRLREVVDHSGIPL